MLNFTLETMPVYMDVTNGHFYDTLHTVLPQFAEYLSKIVVNVPFSTNRSFKKKTFVTKLCQVTQMEGPDGKSLEDFWHFPEDNTDFESLAAMRDTLKSAEPVAAELDRCLTVLPPSQKISRELPADFFNLTKEEVCFVLENKYICFIFFKF